MMRRARLGMGLGLVLVLAGGAACGKKHTAARGSTDSTLTAGVATGAVESTAVAGGGAGAAGAEPDTLMLFTYAERRGMRLFHHYCVVCHGDGGAGDGFNAYNLDPRPRDLTDATYQGAISDETLKEVVTQGGRGMNKSILMPAYGRTLSGDQIADLVAYLRTLAGAEKSEETTGPP